MTAEDVREAKRTLLRRLPCCECPVVLSGAVASGDSRFMFWQDGLALAGAAREVLGWLEEKERSLPSDCVMVIDFDKSYLEMKQLKLKIPFYS